MMKSKKKERTIVENNNPNSGSKFINGFLLGALIGAGAVFLLGTKKGKKLLKAISEEGIGNITKVLQEADQFADIDESEKVEKIIPNKNVTPADENLEDEPEQVRPKVKRFFRGITKRFN